MRRVIQAGIGVLVVAVAILLFVAWPFIAYPTTGIELRLPEPAVQSQQGGVPMAGIAEVDITPPIGIPKFGYAAWARDSDGFRTRLKARAFYFSAPGQTPVALVQLDLGAGSLPLHHRVAELVAAATDVPAHALSLLVTHTHSGPAGYLGSDFYNVFGGNRPGFDPRLFSFLAERIAEAVITARDNRRPARIATGQQDIWGQTRNRSVQAWALNHDLDPDDVGEAEALRAVNPTLTMVRVDLQAENSCFYPAGALSTFSIHGTGIPFLTGPWHADVWTWLSDELEQAVATGAVPAPCSEPSPFTFVHAPAIATHADNNPNYVPAWRGDREARRIGRNLGRKAVALFTRLEPEPRLETAAASRVLDLLTLDQEARFGLCERAIVGASVAGAANDDEVFPIAWLPFLQEGWPSGFLADDCQNAKQWMASRLQLLIEPEHMPHKALIQVMRVNDLVLVPLPWEITLESGNRIRNAVRASLPAGEWRIEISSLANGFFGYAATPEEYSLQYYEGGHTLYGPGTQPFLAQQSARLAADMTEHGNVNDIPAQSRFSLLTRQYWPEAHSARDTVRKEIAQPVYVRHSEELEGHWRWRYQDVAPGSLDLSEPLLSVVDAEGKLVADENRDVLQLVLVEDEGDRALYEVRWFSDQWPARSGLRFRIAPRGIQTLFHSSAF